MAMVENSNRSHSIFHRMIPERFRSKKHKKKYKDASTGEGDMIDQRNMTKDTSTEKTDLNDPRNTTTKQHDKSNHVTINGNEVSLTINFNSIDPENECILKDMKAILDQVCNSKQESHLGKFGNTEIACSVPLDQSDDEEEEDAKKISSPLKDREEEKAQLEPDMDKVRRQISTTVNGKNQCSERVDSGIGSLHSNGLDSVYNSDDVGKQDELETLNLSDNEVSYWFDKMSVTSGPIVSLSRQVEYNDLNHPSMSPEERGTEFVDHCNDLNITCEEVPVDTSLNPSNTISHMNFSTFENDISNVKPYTGDPELGEQTGREHVMESLNTMPKSTGNSMELQKMVQHSPIPDPVPTHEETQPKHWRETSSTMLKSVSHEISSGYPAHSDNSRMEKAFSGTSKASFETELPTSYETECCSSGRLLDEVCDIMHVFGHIGLECEEVQEMDPYICSKSAEVFPLDCAAKSEHETHKDNESKEHAVESETTITELCMKASTTALEEINEAESSNTNINDSSTTPECSKSDEKDSQQNNRAETNEDCKNKEQFPGSTTVDNFDPESTFKEGLSSFQPKQPDKAEGEREIPVDEEKTQMLASDGQDEVVNESELSEEISQNNHASYNDMHTISQNMVALHEETDFNTDKCTKSSDDVPLCNAGHGECEIHREISMNTSNVECNNIDSEENTSKDEMSKQHTEENETTHIDKCVKIQPFTNKLKEINATDSNDLILDVRNMDPEFSQSDAETEDYQQSNMTETIEDREDRDPSYEANEAVHDKSPESTTIESAIIYQNEQAVKEDGDLEIPMAEDSTPMVAAKGTSKVNNCNQVLERSTSRNNDDFCKDVFSQNISLEDKEFFLEECPIQSPIISTVKEVVPGKDETHTQFRMTTSTVENISNESTGGFEAMDTEKCKEEEICTNEEIETDAFLTISDPDVGSLVPKSSRTKREDTDDQQSNTSVQKMFDKQNDMFYEPLNKMMQIIQSTKLMLESMKQGDRIDSIKVGWKSNIKNLSSKMPAFESRLKKAEMKSIIENKRRNKHSKRLKRKSKSECELQSCSLVENGTETHACDSFVSKDSLEQVTLTKLRDRRMSRKDCLSKHSHNGSRRRKRTNWRLKRKNITHSQTQEKKFVRSSLLEEGDTDPEGELQFADSVISDRIDSGVFSTFASLYTSSYESIKRSLESHQSTDRNRILGTDKKTSRREDLLEELRRVLDIEEFRIQEKQLRESLRRITSSWSYFTPESFIPWQYPGVLQSYFDRLQSGEQMSLQERYSYEWIRFQSFDQYAGNGSGIVLSRNGFYHDSENGPTATRCYACDATYSEWEYFDQVESRHNPGCPHVHGNESGNIPIQPETDHDMQASAHRPDHSPAVGESTEVNLAVVTERNTENKDEATPAKDTAPTGERSDPSSVDSLSNSMQQARIDEQPYQPSQDRENEQYMSSYVVHREDSDLPVNSQDSYASHAQSNLDQGGSLPNPRHGSPTPSRAFGAGIQSGGAAHQHLGGQSWMSNQPSAYSLPTTSSQAPIAGSFAGQSSTADPGTTFTSCPPLSSDTSSSSGDTSSSSGEQSPTDSSSQSQSATSTQSQSATSTQSQASLSNPTSTSAQLLTSSQPTTISQPVTVSENSAASQLALSGAPIASSLNESRALQASGGRHLETPGHIQTHPELIHVDSPKHPEYGSVDSRANTFRGTWPDNLDQTPRRMAEAGFFYTGVADFTRCYACGGGLRNWEAGDDPVIEHTRWYPTCPYVTKLKGEKYVQAVIVKQQQHLEEKRKQQVALSQQRAAQRNPPDPLRTNAAAVLSEMGYSQDRIKDAILAVRQQTGSLEVTAEQALIWILDDDERRNAIAARRAAGSAAFFSSSQTTSTSATSTTTSSATAPSSSGQDATSNQQPAETGIKRPSTSTTGNQQSTETGFRHSASAGNLQPTASGNQHSGGTGSQPSSLEAGGNQQGATGGGEDETKKDEGSQSSGGKSRRKRRNKKGGQSASLPTEGASGNSGDLPPSTAEGATGNSGNLPPNTDTQSLRDENEKLRDIQTCKICLDKPVDTTFLPCGHLVCCGRCASKMRKCPICRKPIRGSVKTFMS